jgi:hypothetical protein
MSRKFFSMLIVAFLLQLSWGVASAYCMHETGKASQHFGHHQHQHQPSGKVGDDNNGGSKPKKAAFHADCASCTHGTIAPHTYQPATPQPMPLVFRASTNSAPQPAPYLGLPERPQWQRAA